jgi:hypothetical protein
MYACVGAYGEQVYQNQDGLLDRADATVAIFGQYDQTGGGGNGGESASRVGGTASRL